MKDITYNEKEYIEGFNLGYKVSKDLPELAELISQVKSEGAKFDGLRDGREQYVYDLGLEKGFDKEQDYSKKKNVSPNLTWLNNDRLDELDNNIDLDKDKDIEPEL